MTDLSISDLIRFTPASYEGRDGAPVYLRGPLGFRGRARLRADLQASGAVFPPQKDFVSTAIRLIRKAGPDNQAELLSPVEAYQDLLELETLQPLTDDASDEEKAAHQTELDRRRAIIAPYEKVLDMLRGQPDLDRLFAQQRLFHELAPPMAAAYGLRGWENVKATFKRVNGVVPDEVLDELPEADLTAIGNEVLRAMNVSATQRGN